MPDSPLFIGLDIGTSGARAVVIGQSGEHVAAGRAAMSNFGEDHRAPSVWWRAAENALRAALADVDRSRVAGICVDGTSGTMLPVDARGAPLAAGRMYNDPCNDAGLLELISKHAPEASAAHGPTSGFAKAMLFQPLGPTKVLHQADWIAFRLSGRFISDANNALKTGYDPVEGRWPVWIENAGLDAGLLPDVAEPGAVTGEIARAAAQWFGLPDDVRIVAGTTDGCASFLATGAEDAGDGVTALGTTLTIKLLSDEPIFAPEYGIYSHRILGKWLAGGASNTGGNVLLKHFTQDEIESLSALIDPETCSGLDYYPLAGPGERFPVADPRKEPRLDPRPDKPEDFLKALFEGITAIEKLGYDRLAELGAPALKSVRTVGGGAANPVWTRIRARSLGVALPEPLSNEAAYGAALLARRAA